MGDGDSERKEDPAMRGRRLQSVPSCSHSSKIKDTRMEGSQSSLSSVATFGVLQGLERVRGDLKDESTEGRRKSEEG